VLTTDTEAPVVTETTVSADLLQALEIVTELGGDTVGEDLAVLAIDDIALPVEEPGGDLVCRVSASLSLLERWSWRTLERVLDDGNDTLKLFGGEVTSALGQIDIGLLADQVGVSATDTRDLGQGVHDLLLAIDVRVQQTDDVLEAGKVSNALVVRICLRLCAASMQDLRNPKTISHRNWPLQSEQHNKASPCTDSFLHLSATLDAYDRLLCSLSLASECCRTGRRMRGRVSLWD